MDQGAQDGGRAPRRGRRFDPAEAIHQRAARLRFQQRRFAGCQSHADLLEQPLRVVQLTDLHVGRITPEEVQWTAVDLANDAAPDLVCLTGDYVAHSQVYLSLLEELVRRIEAPVLAVMGNHDHWAGVGEVRGALQRGGAEVLGNACTVLELKGQRLQVLGLDDAYTAHAQPDRALRQLQPGLPTLGLSHVPEAAEALWRGGVPLVLSGHTHAGQVTVARLHELALGRFAGHRYVHGLYGSRTGKEGAVYVSAGIGASVMPLRVGQAGQREITIFELGLPPASIPEPLTEREPLKGKRPSARKLLRRRQRIERLRRRREKKSDKD
ncbi:MAG: metallophosphoesterase [Deltaproteobacteria bacterium]|nr:metallophosphoesterase [Deltaproteobacteria bacterium]